MHQIFLLEVLDGQSVPWLCRLCVPDRRGRDTEGRQPPEAVRFVGRENKSQVMGLCFSTAIVLVVATTVEGASPGSGLMAGPGVAAAEAAHEGVQEMRKRCVFMYVEGTASLTNSA